MRIKLVWTLVGLLFMDNLYFDFEGNLIHKCLRLILTHQVCTTLPHLQGDTHPPRVVVLDSICMLIHWGPVTHIFVIKLYHHGIRKCPVAFWRHVWHGTKPLHKPVLLIPLDLRNKLWWNSNKIRWISMRKMHLECWRYSYIGKKSTSAHRL